MRSSALALLFGLLVGACQSSQAPQPSEPSPAPAEPAPARETPAPGPGPATSASATPPPVEPAEAVAGDASAPEQCGNEQPFTRLPKSSRAKLDPALGVRNPKWKTVIAADGKFSASIPTGVFAVRQVAGGLLLESGLVVDSPHGVVDPGDESRHWFRGFIVRRALPLVETICDGALYASPRALLAEAKTTPSGQDLPIHIPGGAHGYETAQYYVSLGDKDTLMLHFDLVGEFVSHGVAKRHQALLQQQQQIIDRIVDSLAVQDP